MALRPWLPEREISSALAAELIAAQFPALAPVQAAPLGAGWDNTVFEVNGEYVFRFPRRQIAVPLLEREMVVLPRLSGRLPLATPAPEQIGAATEQFPWPFMGYRKLDGITADEACLTDAQRSAAAKPLGEFLRALHAIPLDPGRDAFHRMDAARMRKHSRDRLRELGWPLPGWFDATVRAPVRSVPVHGDLHARQLLVKGGALCGVIDWGDTHLGDPACDLAIGWMLLPVQTRAEFLHAYGGADDATWALARLRALHLSAALAVYARHTSDERLSAEALRAFEFVRTS